MEFKKRAELLLKNSWSYRDIMQYMETIGNKISVNKALELKSKAVENGGVLSYKFGHVTVDSVLRILGTSKEKELSYLNIIKGIEEGELSNEK